MNYHEPFVIAEIGCNHKGEMEIAKELIKIAAIFCGADAVKFQKRNNRELLTEQQYNSPHPNPVNAYGNTYGEHREFLEFSVEQHAQLQSWCEEFGIEYSSSVWDLTSAQAIASLEPGMIKIPSACNTNVEMITWLCQHFPGDIHVSLGMTTREEEQQLIKLFDHHQRTKDLVLYSCTSGYPVPFEDVALLEITRLVDAYGDRVKQIGFSGHHLGIAVDVAAYTLGASVIERHYTLDRTWKGTDHAASLEPDGLRRVKRDLKAVNKALSYKKVIYLRLKQYREKS